MMPMSMANPALNPIDALKQIKEEDKEEKQIVGDVVDPLSIETSPISQKYECADCDYTTCHKGHLKVHLREVHKMGNMLRCGECKYTTYKKKSFDTHMLRTHQKGECLKCNQCVFITPHSDKLKRHMRVVHRNGKLFHCDNCEYKTHIRMDIKIHLRQIHGKRELFQCEDCEFKSHNRSEMKGHTRSIHGKDHVLKCEECEFMSKRGDTMLSHMARAHVESQDAQPMHPTPATKTYSRKRKPGGSTGLSLMVSDSLQKDDDKLDSIDDQKGNKFDITYDQKDPVDSDTDTASETEDAMWQKKDKLQTIIDVDPTVTPPHDISLYNEKVSKKDQGVQVDNEYTMKHELGWLREHNKKLRQENKALKEAVEKGLEVTAQPSECVQNAPNTVTSAENEYSWTKKLRFFTKLTLEQCSALYDSLDPKGREVLLSVVSEQKQAK